LRSELEAGSFKPFDAALAYNLYEQILGPVKEFVSRKSRLSFVLSGALTSLPPQVLVTNEPEGKPLNSVSWLVRKYAVTVLPSTASLKVLRGNKNGQHAAEPMIGFGDPVFEGTMEAATKPTKPKVTSLDKGLPAFYRGGLTADTKSLATALPPLPETADELRRVAREFGAKAEDIYLREAASVPNVKHAPLDKYRVVYFATHALVAGEVKKFAKARAEPALVLSIPEKPTHEDDGLLRASDVAMLRMNADFVVLSACNTAAGDKPGAEALSGLARAFLYAGARSLIVSNWEVDSESTVALMTDLFDALKNDPHLSHAEALWLSMLRMIDNPPQSEWTQPRFWAPFVVVGEPQKDWMIHSHFSRSFTGWRSFLATSSAYTRDPRPTTKYVDKLPSSWGPRRIEPSSTDPAGEDITAARRDP
jgi:CHAT domain-containing protein